jgi:hypothetical protein
MVEELGEGVWGAETRCGQSEGRVSLVRYIYRVECDARRMSSTYLVQALEYILKDARPLGAVAR